jgi:hypothetical protein
VCGDGELVLYGFVDYDRAGDARENLEEYFKSLLQFVFKSILVQQETSNICSKFNKRQSIWQPVLLVVRPSGFTS